MQADANVEVDYRVALFLADADEVPVAQGMDGVPNGGFTPTNGWQTGDIVQDNRALRLAEDTPPGSYRLWLRLYTAGNDGLEHLPLTGGPTIENSIAILPVTITVEDNAN